MGEDTGTRKGPMDNDLDPVCLRHIDSGSEPPPATQRTLFFDIQSTTGAQIDQLITESIEIIAKAAASAVVLYFSITQLFDEIRTYHSLRQGTKNDSTP